MSTSDREKWDERYRSGAFAERPHPSALLNDWIERLPGGRALDLACGAGRNSLFLARHGFEVTGVDISAVGLDRARSAAHREGLKIAWRQHDLDGGLDIPGRFEVVCLFRYLNRPLIRRLPELLAPDGVVLVEEHLVVDQGRTQVPIFGPGNPAFLVSPRELARLLASLTVLLSEEGIVADPDGRHVALSRLVGTNTAGNAPD